MKRKYETSYVLAILNAERTLEECLNSIFSQEYPREKYEVIIVDGGSNDKTLEIVKKFMKKYKNIRLIHNPHKLSEGRGMGKAMGINSARGEFVAILDHDNIIMQKDWIKKMLFPFKDNPEVMASQSMLDFRENDGNFLKYVNAAGVEDAFAIPYSLVAQVVFHPEKFEFVKNRYYIHKLDKNNVLFGGANGCIFRKEVFDIIKGYTRDVNVSASMADHAMTFAVVKNAKIHHKTGSNFLSFLKKKIIYFHRFISYGYKEENFKWVPSSLQGKARFSLMVLGNLTLIVPLLIGARQWIRTGRAFWLLHPFYVFCMTLVYGLVTLLKMKNYMSYVKKR